MFPLKQAFCFDATVPFLHPDRSIKHDIPYPYGRIFWWGINGWRSKSVKNIPLHTRHILLKHGFVTENVEGLAQPVRAFDHICMEKARYKFLIIIIIIIFKIIIITKNDEVIYIFLLV